MGLDLQAICDQSQLHRELGLKAQQIPGGVSLVAQLTSTSGNGTDGQVVHGGVVALLLDAATTFALIAASGYDWITVDLRVDYLLPLNVGPVEARAQAVSIGRTLARAQASISGSDGRTAALAIATFRRGPQLESSDAS